MDRYIRNYFVVAVAGMFCWLNTSVVSAQTATNVDCFWCVGPGEVGYGAVPWASLSPSLRQNLQAQQDQINDLQEQVDDLSDPAGVIVVDFSVPDGCVIDQSGHYVLDRSWSGSSEGNLACHAPFNDAFIDQPIILINAPSVILDLRGFVISGGEFQPDFDPTIGVENSRVTIRNGSVFGSETAIDAVGSARVRLENMVAPGSLLGDNSYVNDSRFFCGPDTQALDVGSNSIVLNSEISCSGSSLDGPPALFIHGTAIQVRNNTIKSGWGIGFGNAAFAIIEGNVIEATCNRLGCGGIFAFGNNHIIARNIISSDRGAFNGITVNGTGTAVDANIITEMATGIFFGMDGNYYGDNRVSATTPFDLGGTTQTDWGGNVSF